IRCHCFSPHPVPLPQGEREPKNGLFVQMQTAVKGGARSAGGFVAVAQVHESCGVRFSALMLTVGANLVFALSCLPPRRAITRIAPTSTPRTHSIENRCQSKHTTLGHF